jgi:hypothetical protein
VALTQKQKSLYHVIRATLRHIWNPIAANVPDDEYDSYAMQVLGKLLQRTTAQELGDYLWHVQADLMGQQLPDDRCQVVAELLLHVRSKWEQAVWL